MICPYCNGEKGRQRTSEIQIKETCPSCEGRGWAYCTKCDGTGNIHLTTDCPDCVNGTIICPSCNGNRGKFVTNNEGENVWEVCSVCGGYGSITCTKCERGYISKWEGCEECVKGKKTCSECNCRGWNLVIRSEQVWEACSVCGGLGTIK